MAQRGHRGALVGAEVGPRPDRRVTLRRVLNVAVESEILGRSPCVAVKPPALRQDEMRFLSAGEVVALVDAMHPHFRALVLTAAYTGLRWGELIGLRRANLSLEGASLAVVEQLVYLDREWLRKPPKTRAGRRRVGLPAFLVDELRAHVEARVGPAADALVFPNTVGRPIHTPSFNSSQWKPAKAKVGLEGVRFHDLRHTAVALAIAQGAHPKAIQARMGHSSVQVTLDRYGHLFPELDNAITVGLDETYRRSLTVLHGGQETAPEDTRRTRRTQKATE